jgi:hypothetical protein
MIYIHPDKEKSIKKFEKELEKSED